MTNLSHQEIIQAWVGKNNLIDPERYSNGKDIVWSRSTALEVAFNEFDLEILYEESFDVFNNDHIKERWPLFYLHCKKLTGKSLDDIVKLYVLQREIPYVTVP